MIRLGIIAFVQVRFFESILEMAIYAYTVYGVGITPALMAAFFWKRATAAGAVVSMSAGAVITVGWELIAKKYYGDFTVDFGWVFINKSVLVSDIITVYPALFSSLAALIIVSLLTDTPDRSKWSPYIAYRTATVTQTCG